MNCHWINRKLCLTNHLRTLRIAGVVFATSCFLVSVVNAETYTYKSSIKDEKYAVDDLHQKSDVITIKGKVMDVNSEPLIGVSILVKGKHLGTTTDIDGNFELRIPLSGLDGFVLQFTYIGFKSKEVVVSDSRTLPVVMEEDISEITEVVVTGYQVVDKRYSTSAITSVKASDVLVPGMTSIDQALEGRIPELLLMNNSGEVGSTPRLRVRGTSTLMGNREPLWVLDGFIINDPVAVSNDELNDPDYINIIGNAIAGINPQDIDRIDVLKDASATALYGTRAANGVIVVTTKKGTVGKPKVSYSHSSKITSRPRYSDRNVNLMSSQERVQFGKDLSDLHYKFPSNMTMVGYEGALHRYYTGQTSYSQFLDEVKSYETTNTDWFKILTRDSYTGEHTIGLSGGADNLRYYSSIGYSGENGVSKTTFSDRYTMRTNMNLTLSEKVLANFSVNGNFIKKNSLNSELNLVDYAYNTTRAIPYTNPDGSLFYYDHIGYGGKNRPSNKFRYNIMNELEQSSNTYEGSTLGASLDLRFKLTKDFETSVSGNYSRSSTLQEQWWGERSHYVARYKNGEYEEIPKSGQQGYSIDNQSRIYFQYEKLNSAGRLIQLDSIVFSFGKHPMHIKEDTAKIVLNIMGDMSPNDRKYKIEVIDRGDIVSGVTNMIEGVHYDLFEKEQTFRSNRYTDTLKIKVYRDQLSASLINPESKGLILRLLPNDNFQLGINRGHEVRLVINNLLTPPAWWEIHEVFLGFYHPKKWLLLIDLDQIFENEDYFAGTGVDIQNKGAMLKDYLNKNILIDDETGKRISFEGLTDL